MVPGAKTEHREYRFTGKYHSFTSHLGYGLCVVLAMHSNRFFNPSELTEEQYSAITNANSTNEWIIRLAFVEFSLMISESCSRILLTRVVESSTVRIEKCISRMQTLPSVSAKYQFCQNRSLCKNSSTMQFRSGILF